MKKLILPTIYILIFIGLVSYVLLKVFRPNYEMEPYYKYVPSYQVNQCNLLYEDQFMEEGYYAAYSDGHIYLSFSFLRDYFDEYLYYDAITEKVTLTTKDKVIRIFLNSSFYLENGEEFDLEAPAFYEDDVLLLPYAFFKDYYPLAAHYTPESNIVSVTRRDVARTYLEVTAKTGHLRFEPDAKSAVIEELLRGDRVELLEAEEKWSVVKSESGYIGYLANNQRADEPIQQEADFFMEDRYVTPSYVADSGKINLVWDQVFNLESHNAEFRRVAVDGLDVLSPTWFSITSENAHIKSIANHAYVKRAHSNGYQVWALVDNDFTGDNMRENTSRFLANTDTRQRVIDALITYAKEFNLDGINFDFESVAEEDGRNFVQFMKEAAILMRREGLVVSVDVYVPRPWTAHYNRQELGIICDYVMVMSYDEHWSTSPVAGSVASIGFVEESIVDMLKEVPAEKILLGLPYYTYLWTEKDQDGEIKVSSKAYGMDSAYALAAANQVEFVWDGETAQYYTEYQENGNRMRLWLEDERSIEIKANLVQAYDIAGVAGWKRGLEKAEIWELLAAVLKK